MPSQLKSFLGTIKRRPSKAPDGRPEEAANGMASNNEKTSVIHDLANLGLKNSLTMAEAIPQLATGEPIDDKKGYAVF